MGKIQSRSTAALTGAKPRRTSPTATMNSTSPSRRTGTEADASRIPCLPDDCALRRLRVLFQLRDGLFGQGLEFRQKHDALLLVGIGARNDRRGRLIAHV